MAGENKETEKTLKKIGEALKEVGKGFKGETKGKSSIISLMSLLISELILFQAFQPIITSHGWGFVVFPILLIIIGVLVIVAAGVLLSETGGGAGVGGILNLGSLVGISIMLIILGIIMLLIIFSGSPELLKLIRIMWSINSAKLGVSSLQSITGTNLAYIILAILAAIVVGITLRLGSVGCFIFPFVLWIILFVVVKPVIAMTGVERYTSIERSVHVNYTVPSVTIPVSGGVSIIYGTEETHYQPATLMGGEPYIYYYTIQNLYEEPESFTIDPWIETKYQYAYIRFKAPQKLKAPYGEALTLNKSEFYQDQIYYDPETMTIESLNQCYYTIAQITRYYGINESEVPCAYEKPCTDNRTVCAKTGSFMCDCLGWTGLTCGGARAYMGMDVWHTGFLIANGTLFYKEEFFQPISNKRTVQGPLAVTPVFFPNPWIEKIHNTTFENVKLALEIENTGGGEIRIKSAKALPSNAEINTTIRGFSEDLNTIIEATIKEELGINLEGCERINDTIPSGTKTYKEFCTFSKPYLNVTIINETTGNVTNSTNIDVKDVHSYCEKGLAKSLNASEETNEYLTEIDKLIGRTGLCEALQPTQKAPEKKETFAKVWREKIENSLKSVNVIVEINYEREFSHSSRSIGIYTDTPECLKYGKK